MIVSISYCIIAACLVITGAMTGRWVLLYRKHMSKPVMKGALVQALGMMLTASVLISDVFIDGGPIHQWAAMTCALFSLALITKLEDRLDRIVNHER